MGNTVMPNLAWGWESAATMPANTADNQFWDTGSRPDEPEHLPGIPLPVSPINVAIGQANGVQMIDVQGRLWVVDAATRRPYYSDDGGVTWLTTLATGAFGDSITTYSIATDGTGIVVVTQRSATINQTFYSRDSGVNWGTAANVSTASGSAPQICYCDGKFIRITAGVCGVSTDGGENWTTGVLPSTANWGQIVCGNGVFVAQAISTGVVIQSTDGLNWKNIVGLASVAIYGLISSGTRLLAASTTGTISHSDDGGDSWDYAVIPSATVFRNLASDGNGTIIAVAESLVFRSTDNGDTWAQTNSGVTTSTWQNVCWTGTQFVIVARASTGSNYAMTSPTGVTWTDSPIGAGNWYGVAYGGGVCVAVANSGTIKSTTDFVTWNSRTPATGFGNPSRVTYGGGRFVTCSTNGKITYSNDGTTWLGAASAPVKTWFDVYYANSVYVVSASLTAPGAIAYSSDASNWTLATIPTSATVGTGPLAYNGTSFFTASFVSSTVTIRKSDGTAVNWVGVNTARGGSRGYQRYGLTFNGTHFVSTLYNQPLPLTEMIETSTDGLHWLGNSSMDSQVTVQAQLLTVISGGGINILLGTGSLPYCWTSSDLNTWTKWRLYPNTNTSGSYAGGNFYIGIQYSFFKVNPNLLPVIETPGRYGYDHHKYIENFSTPLLSNPKYGLNGLGVYDPNTGLTDGEGFNIGRAGFMLRDPNTGFLYVQGNAILTTDGSASSSKGWTLYKVNPTTKEITDAMPGYASKGLGYGEYDMQILADGKLYVAGYNLKAGTSRFTRCDLSSGTWEAFGTPNGLVSCFGQDELGNVYIGGSFTNVSGTARTYLAKWNGSAWALWGATGYPNNVVNCMHVVSSTEIYIGGAFTTVDGVSAPYVSMWNGTAWTALTTFPSACQGIRKASDGTLYARTATSLYWRNGAAWAAITTPATRASSYYQRSLIEGPDGAIYMGGYISTTVRKGIVLRVDPTTKVASSFLEAGNNEIADLVWLPGGKIAISGKFNTQYNPVFQLNWDMNVVRNTINRGVFEFGAGLDYPVVLTLALTTFELKWQGLTTAGTSAVTWDPALWYTMSLINDGSTLRLLRDGVTIYTASGNMIGQGLPVDQPLVLGQLYTPTVFSGQTRPPVNIQNVEYIEGYVRGDANTNRSVT